MKVKHLVVAFLCMLGCCACSSPKTEVKSPDGHIKMTLTVDENGTPFYNVSVNDSLLIENSKMGFVEGNGVILGGGFRIEKTTFDSKDETWTQPWGENKTNRNPYNEMAVNLINEDQVQLTLRFRVFNDGVGFRYEYNVPNVDSLMITDELTTFHFRQDGTSWSIPASAETYELLYKQQPISEVETANTPFTFKTADGVYGSIHEAALYDFSEMTLKQIGDYTLKAELTPWPDGIKVRKSNHFTTSWRTIQIAPEAVGLINSSLILNLNDPCVLETTDWIRPLKYIGVWWGMHLGVETWKMDERHGATTVNAKKYIDFAAANNIEAVLFEGWNEGWEDWASYRKDRQFLFDKPYPDFDVAVLHAYAKSKGVKIIMHHETAANAADYERQLDVAFQFMVDNGYNSVKTGYVGSIIPRSEYHSSQWMNNHYIHVVKRAADYKIMVDSHEAVRPTGLCRTWPNWVAQESARGGEFESMGGNDPDHTCILPFTRLKGGPMDYTPGIFQTKLSYYNSSKPKGQAGTTLVKQLALYVTMPSPLQMAADLPDNYRRFPDAFQFIKDVAVDWSNSWYLEAEPGDYITVARQAKGKQEWYVGAITDEHPRTATIPFSFLPEGRKYIVTVYADGRDADWKDNPQSYDIRRGIVTSKSVLRQPLASSGGVAISVREATKEEVKGLKKL